MTTHTINGFLTYRKRYDEVEVSFCTYDPTVYAYNVDLVIIRPHSFDVNVPDSFDPRPDLIKNLRAKEQRARADFELLLTEIRSEISKHEALEYTPVV